MKWYVKNLVNNNYYPSLWCILWIHKNYSFLLNLLNKDSKILEIGPGNWAFIDYLLINEIENITTVDLDEENVECLKYKYKKIKWIDAVYADWLDYLDKNKQKFDLIISRQVLEHFNPSCLNEYFKLCYKNLKDDWILITETINAQNIIFWCFHRYDDATHKNSFTEKSIKQYSMWLFNHIFYWYKNISLLDLFFSKLREKYNKLELLIDHLNNLDSKKEANSKKNSRFMTKLWDIKKVLNFIIYKYYYNKSIRISRRFLWDENHKVFSCYIIAVSKKI